MSITSVRPTRLYYSLKEAADLLGVSLSFMRHRIEDGTFTPVKIGRLVKIPASQLQASNFMSVENGQELEQ